MEGLLSLLDETFSPSSAIFASVRGRFILFAGKRSLLKYIFSGKEGIRGDRPRVSS